MSLKQRFISIILTIGVLFAFFIYQTNSLYQRSRRSHGWMTHTNKVINRLEAIYTNVWQLQAIPGSTNVAGDVFRKSVEKSIKTNFDSLKTYTSDNPFQQKKLSAFSEMIVRKVDLVNQSNGTIYSPAMMKLDDSLKNIIGQMIDTEYDYLIERTKTYEHNSRTRFLFTTTCSSLLALFLFISLYQAYKSIARRTLLEQHAKDQEERYRLLVEGSQFTTLILDRNAVIRFVSSNVLRLTGYRKDQLEGTDSTLDVPTAEEWDNNPELANATYERQIDLKGGGKKWLSYRMFPLRNEAGRIDQWQVMTWDIDAEKRLEEELKTLDHQREQQQRIIQEIIDNIPSSIIIKDIEGRYVVVNKKTCELLKMRAEELVGKVDTEVFKGKDFRTNFRYEDEQVIARKSMVTLEDMVRSTDGKKQYLWITKFPLFDDNGEVQYVCGVSTDITERKENELKLLKATREAENARSAQETFLANMSHEIRTPMNGIMGMSNLLLSTHQSDEQREYSENILESARHLLAIINDILDFSKIRSGKFQFEFTAFKPRHAIRKAIYPLQFKAEEKLVKLTLNIANDVPEVLLGDPLRLQQIVINLVSNALKFTSKGSVDVTVRCRKSGPDYCEVELLVKDSGIGIAQDKLKMIFESFTQNNVNTSRKYGGTGLGLAIVKQMVELQSGRVWVESTLGEGSTFGFTIPYKVSDEPMEPIIAHHQLSNDNSALLKDIQILVAEDNLINQKVVSSTLSKRGAVVTVVGNGQLAIDAVGEKRYDLILMDLQMPEVDGYKATRHIRRVLQDDIPIIAMTADALKGEAEKCFDAGMNGYISKPFEPNELYQEILKQSRSKPTIIQTKDTMNAELIDFSYLQELSGNDPEYIKEVIDLFLGTMPDGLEQLEHQIKNTNDWDGIYRQSHFLKSSVSVIRIRDMFDNLSKIESMARNKTDKDEMIRIFDGMKATYAEAHPLLLAERDKQQPGNRI